MRIGILSLITVIAVSGCATNQPISAAEKSSVKFVALSNEIPVPPNMSYLGPGGATGMAFGAIGAAVAAPGMEKERQEFQSRTGTGKTIDRIVYEETLGQLKASGKFALVEKADAGVATMQVTVLNYGFSIPHGFSSSLVPMLGLRYELRDSSGRPLWTATDRTLPLGNPVESVDAKEIAANPAAREASLRAAARALAARMIATY